LPFVKNGIENPFFFSLTFQNSSLLLSQKFSFPAFPGADALPYQEKDVKRALREV